MYLYAQMPAHALVSHEQMEILVAFMEENRELATGRPPNIGPMAKKVIKTKWEEVAAKLNSVGVTKPAPKWRDYWNEKKYVVRRRVKGLNICARDTDGGPVRGVSLTPIEERIYNIMGKVAVFAETSVRIPFSEPSDVPPLPPPVSPSPTADELLSAPPLLAPRPIRLPFIPTVSSLQISTGSSSAGTAVANTNTGSTSDAGASDNGTSTEDNIKKEPSPQQWALQIEERWVSAQEKTADAVAVIASALTAIQATLARMEQKMK